MPNFAGTWKMKSSENFDELLKALGKPLLDVFSLIPLFVSPFLFSIVCTVHPCVSFIHHVHLKKYLYFPWALLHFQQYAIVLSHLNEEGGRAYKQAVTGKPSATGDVNDIDMVLL